MTTQTRPGPDSAGEPHGATHASGADSVGHWVSAFPRCSIVGNCCDCLELGLVHPADRAARVRRNRSQGDHRAPARPLWAGGPSWSRTDVQIDKPGGFPVRRRHSYSVSRLGITVDVMAYVLHRQIDIPLIDLKDRPAVEVVGAGVRAG